MPSERRAQKVICGEATPERLSSRASTIHWPERLYGDQRQGKPSAAPVPAYGELVEEIQPPLSQLASPVSKPSVNGSASAGPGVCSATETSSINQPSSVREPSISMKKRMRRLV